MFHNRESIHERPTTSMLSKSCNEEGLHFCMRKIVSSAPDILQKQLAYGGDTVPMFHKQNKTK
jgi:hypothetical protein